MAPGTLGAMTDRRRLVVLFGGQSAEHDVSWFLLDEKGPQPAWTSSLTATTGAEGHPLEIPPWFPQVADVEISMLDGGNFRTSDALGEVLVLDFWATWCPPCIEELPHVKQLYEQHHAEGFEVVGISLDDSGTGLARFLDEQEIPWITLFDADPEKRGFNSPIVNHYGINELPTAILVGRDGKVVSVNAFGDGLAELLEQHLQVESG